MAQIDHGESNVVSSQETSIVPFKPNEQPLEFVDPGESTFGGKATAIDCCVEEPLTTSFGLLAIALILWNVGNHAVIEASFASFAGIEGRISVEISPGDG